VHAGTLLKSPESAHFFKKTAEIYSRRKKEEISNDKDLVGNQG
jgi:hypothetical protein